MRISKCWLLPLLAALAAHAQPDSQADERSRVLSLESAWNQAVQQRDAKAIAPLLADELIYVDDTGLVMSKAEYLASVRSAAGFQHIVSEPVRVAVYGRSAVVVGVYRGKGRNDAKPARGRFVSTWTSRNGVWVCVASQSTLILR
jgi:ketosteroid isomerase-like protein